MQDGLAKELNLNKLLINFQYSNCIKHCIVKSTILHYIVIDTECI